MIIEFNNFDMPNIDLIKLNQEYVDKVIKIKILRYFARQYVSKEEEYIIEKIYLKDPNIYDKERRSGSLIIKLKGKYSREIEITSETIYMLEQYANPSIIKPLSDNLKDIVNLVRN